MTLRSLIKQYRDEHDLSQRQFATLCGLSNGYISMIEKNTNPNTGLPLTPSIPALNKIAAVLGYTLDELLTIADDMPVTLRGASPAPLPKGVIPLPETKLVPLIGTIACGSPALALENPEERIQMPGFVHADFALRCKGDSMITARIFDGDIVYIKQQPVVDNGEIAAVLIGDETTLKKVYYTPGSDRIVLQACNPMYPDMVYSGEQLNEIEILGKAVWFASKVRS